MRARQADKYNNKSYFKWVLVALLLCGGITAYCLFYTAEQLIETAFPTGPDTPVAVVNAQPTAETPTAPPVIAQIENPVTPDAEYRAPANESAYKSIGIEVIFRAAPQTGQQDAQEIREAMGY